MMCSNTNISFTSRCQSIEMARSACRKITMFSTTKNQHTVQKLKQTNREAMEFFEDYAYMPEYTRGSKMFNMLNSYMNCSNKLVSDRKHFGDKADLVGVQNLLQHIKTKHVGNCGESAEGLSAILAMNGVENAYFTTIKNGESAVDHEICVFNRDGSVFDGEIKNNKTIIIDAWLGIVDFANTALKQIKAAGAKYLYLNPYKDVTIDTRNIGKFDLSKREIDVLRELHPEFVI